MINDSLAQRLFGGISLLSDFSSDNLWGSISTGTCSLPAHAFPVFLTIHRVMAKRGLSQTWSASSCSLLGYPVAIVSAHSPGQHMGCQLAWFQVIQKPWGGEMVLLRFKTLRPWGVQMVLLRFKTLSALVAASLRITEIANCKFWGEKKFTDSLAI